MNSVPPDIQTEASQVGRGCVVEERTLGVRRDGTKKEGKEGKIVKRTLSKWTVK
jgi:hypothetical protein